MDTSHSPTFLQSSNSPEDETRDSEDCMFGMEGLPLRVRVPNRQAPAQLKRTNLKTTELMGRPKCKQVPPRGLIEEL